MPEFMGLIKINQTEAFNNLTFKYTGCPKKNWELLLVIVAVTPSFFWDTLYKTKYYLQSYSIQYQCLNKLEFLE